MAKVLLVNSPLTNEEIYSGYGAVSAVLPPMGICYIAAVLEQDSHKVRIVDGMAERLNKESVLERVKEFRPDIVGITTITVGYNRAIETAKLIKEYNEEILVLIGGPHISSVPKKVFEEQECFDIGVVGEGEYTAKELIKYLEKKKFKDYKDGLKKINGIVYKNKEKVIETQRRPLIENLDELPLPARHLLPDIKLYNLVLMDQEPNFASVIPSRGCPFQCIYCDQNVFGRKWRCFSAEYLINEVEELVKMYGVRTIQIQDDLFTLKRDRIMKFCKLLKDKDIKINWNLSSRVNLIDEDLAKIMKDSGCEVVYFGIESGDFEILKKIKKAITIKEIRSGVKIAKKAGLEVHGSFIIGLPFDTKETIEKTIKLAKSLPLDVATFHIATPYPNTEFEKMALNYGQIHIFDYAQYRGHPDEVVFTPKGISGEYLLKKQKEAYRRFYFRPKIIFKKLKSINSLKKAKGYIDGAIAIVK